MAFNNPFGESFASQTMKQQQDRISGKKAERDRQEALLADQARRASVAEDIAQLNKGGLAEQEAFRRLAEQRLGGMSQFATSERAREALLRNQARGQAVTAQQLMAQRLAGQGLRGGAAAAANRGLLNQQAAQQAQISNEMIAGRGEREQALRQQLLASELAGRQFGGAQASQALQARLAMEAQEKAAKARK